jgi:hypothetical protein
MLLSLAFTESGGRRSPGPHSHPYMEQGSPAKLIVLLIIKNLRSFYKIERSIAVLTRSDERYRL